MGPDMTEKIYKIFTQEQWDAFERAGIFRGSPVDLKDGYIHFSTEAQLEKTLRKHFSGQNNLVIACFNVASFDQKLKWEPASSGDIYPHLYSTLEFEAVQSTQKI